MISGILPAECGRGPKPMGCRLGHTIKHTICKCHEKAHLCSGSHILDLSSVALGIRRPTDGHQFDDQRSRRSGIHPAGGIYFTGRGAALWLPSQKDFQATTSSLVRGPDTTGAQTWASRMKKTLGLGRASSRVMNLQRDRVGIIPAIQSTGRRLSWFCFWR